MSLILLAVLLVSLGGCSEKDDAERVLKLGHSLDTSHPVHKAMEFMADKVAEKSGGRLRVEIFPGEQLGSEKECIESLQLGYLAMTKTSTAPMESFVPSIKV
ncbi:MAG: TRAP transporter substrate-binding protein DctP, partial [Planctomycetota bacterium]